MCPLSPNQISNYTEEIISITMSHILQKRPTIPSVLKSMLPLHNSDLKSLGCPKLPLYNVHLNRWSHVVCVCHNSVSMSEPLFFRECVTNIDMKGPFLFKHSFKVANNGQML